MDSDNLSALTGQLERITYHSDETGFTIARLKVPGRRELVPAVGPIANPAPGELLAMQGQWVRHPKYGEQFKIASCESVVPATVLGIENTWAPFDQGLAGHGQTIVEASEADPGGPRASPRPARGDRRIGPKRVALILKAWAEQ
jgi:exodeoxyribonuclease V alpha subunit